MQRIDLTGATRGVFTITGPAEQPSHWTATCPAKHHKQFRADRFKAWTGTKRCTLCTPAIPEAKPDPLTGRRNYLYSLHSNMRRRVSTQEYGNSLGLYKPWAGSQGFTSFRDWIRANLGERPSEQHSLDRIDFQRPYMPGNVRWADSGTQATNRSSSKWLYYTDGIRTWQLTRSELKSWLEHYTERPWTLKKLDSVLSVLSIQQLITMTNKNPIVQSLIQAPATFLKRARVAESFLASQEDRSNSNSCLRVHDNVWLSPNDLIDEYQANKGYQPSRLRERADLLADMMETA